MTRADPIEGVEIPLAAADGTRLAAWGWAPDGCRDVVLLVHGIASHVGWYRELARQLAGEGIAVYAADRRGCGRSEGPPGHAPDWRTLIADLRQLASVARQRHPGAALHGFGISLGAVLVLAAAIEEPSLFRRLVLMAPGIVPGTRISVLRRLRVLRRALFQPTHLYELPFGVQQLTDRPEWRAALAADGLRSTKASARFLVEMFKMQRFVRKRIAAIRHPMLALLAGNDAIIDSAATERVLSEAASDALHIDTLVGVPHVIPASLPAAELLARLAGWVRGPDPSGRHVRHSAPERRDPAELPAPPVW